MNIEYNDVQSLVFNDLAQFSKSNYILFEITDSSFKHWLSQKNFSNSSQTLTETETVLQIAFTLDGLQKLNIPSQTLNEFPQPMHLGMSGRAEMLGDIRENAPENWRWGHQQPLHKNPNPLHGVIMLFTSSAEEKALQDLETELENNGCKIIQNIASEELAGSKEHFGFKDGIANPNIAEKQQQQSSNDIAPGEILLGYKNEYDKLAISPQVYTESSCSLKEVEKGVYDFGYNGSFLVFRQLKQKVDSFWNSFKDTTNSNDEAIHLASKMVGRWPNGNPLALSDNPDSPELEDQKNFHYEDDPFGEKTPLSSHLRRSNPRNSHEFLTPKHRITFEKRHRILRRGRPYGKPTAPSMDIQKMQQTPDNQQEKGLLFLALNASISRQFEFIQSSWNNNPKFAAAYNDSDPVMGNANKDMDQNFLDDDLKPTFTIPAQPFPQKVPHFMNFVQMMGGAYFFLPGIRAIKHVANS